LKAWQNIIASVYAWNGKVFVSSKCFQNYCLCTRTAVYDKSCSIEYLAKICDICMYEMVCF